VTWLDRLLGGWGLDDERRVEPRGDPERVRAVNAILDELQPMFVADGGEVRLVAVEDGWVVVELRGACRTCHASEMSLQGALEPRLRSGLTWFAGLRRA
jgi:Fe-S cluster biogenesis protein NfuA